MVGLWPRQATPDDQPHRDIYALHINMETDLRIYGVLRKARVRIFTLSIIQALRPPIMMIAKCWQKRFMSRLRLDLRRPLRHKSNRIRATFKETPSWRILNRLNFQNCKPI